MRRRRLEGEGGSNAREHGGFICRSCYRARRNSGARSSRVRGGIRRQETDQVARDRREDGMDQSTHVDPHRREEAERQDGTLDDRRRSAQCALQAGIYKELATDWNRNRRRGLPGQRWLNAGEREGYHVSEWAEAVSRFLRYRSPSRR